MKFTHILAVCCLCLFTIPAVAQTITSITPDNLEQGLTTDITITTSSPFFIPGTSNFAVVSAGFTSLTVSGMATSPTSFTGSLTVPIFAFPGSFDVTVYSGPGCSGPSITCVGCFTVCAPKNVFATVTDASCFGCTDGAIDILVFGGAAPLEYEWSNGSMMEDLTGVPGGDYTVTITDAVGCETIRDYTIDQPQPFTLTPSSADAGESLGIIAVGNGTNFIPGTTTCIEFTNGNQTYTFSGNASSPTGFLVTADFPMAAPGGFYDVTIYGGPGCNGMEWPCENCFFICTDINLSAEVTDPSCAICSDGSIDLTVTGGTPPYTFTWSNNSQVEDPTGLIGGDYTVTVTDVGGCTAEATYSVEEPDPIAVNPVMGNPGSSVSVIITGVGTNFMSGTTTCAEISNGTDTYTITGNATNTILFNGILTLPLGASTGAYNATIFEGPDCTGNSWSCSDCFTVVDVFNCDGTVFDAGGNNGDYPNNANDEWTICPDFAGEVVSVTFSSFNLENDGQNCLDQLLIYDGDNTGAPVIASPNGTTNGWCFDQDDAMPDGSGDLTGMTISSSDPSGCLTFVFQSDDMGTRSGWEFDILCTQPIVFTPEVANQASLVNLTVNGFGTFFEPGVTTCLELNQNATTYTIDGEALSPTLFQGEFDIPLEAPTGFYNATIFSGPGCVDGFTQAAWNCFNCFRINPPLLSVEWVLFDAILNRSTVDLIWSTASELNSSHFEVLRSADGTSWSVIGQVEAAGNASDLNEYYFNDADPIKGENYYQIRQVDLDGSNSLSGVKVVLVGNEGSTVEINPNPVRDIATVVVSSNLQEEAIFSIHDITGKLVKQFRSNVTIGTEVTEWNLEDLPKGIFILTVESQQQWAPVRFSKVR